MKPEPLTKEKIRTHLEQDEEGRWVIHISGIRTIDVKSAVEWLLEEIEKEKRLFSAYGNIKTAIQNFELFKKTVSKEDLEWWLRGIEDFIKNVEQSIRKAFEGVME